MKNRKSKLFFFLLVLILFIATPFIDSFLFSHETKNGIDVNQKIKAKFIKSNKTIVLLFFGYVGCEDVCTPIMQQFTKMYNSQEFSLFRKDVAFIFVNLKPEMDTFQPDLFAKYFDKDFQGVYISRNEMLKIDRGFNLFFSPGLRDKTSLNHSDNIYLIENHKEKKILRKIYFTHPLNTEKLLEDIAKMEKKLAGKRR